MNHLGLFAKYWQPGQVKTRLAAGIGPQQASQIYYAFLCHLLEVLGGCGNVRTVSYCPDDKKDEFAHLTRQGSWGLVPQHGDDLGKRMGHFFAWALQRNNIHHSEKIKVVLIGSDTPHLTPVRVEQAFEALEQSPIVLGPSSDGGYYLIGMTDKCFPVFDEVNWSTSKVLEQTMAHLEKTRVAWKLLPEMIDIDDLDDLNELIKILESNLSPQNLRLLKAINAVNYQAQPNE